MLMSNETSYYESTNYETPSLRKELMASFLLMLTIPFVPTSFPSLILTTSPSLILTIC